MRRNIIFSSNRNTEMIGKAGIGIVIGSAVMYFGARAYLSYAARRSIALHFSRCDDHLSKLSLKIEEK